MKGYKVKRRDMANLIAKLAYAIKWEDEHTIEVSFSDVDEYGNMNVYVDGNLAATLYGKE